jgi:hypothetical protein
MNPLTVHRWLYKWTGAASAVCYWAGSRMITGIWRAVLRS